MKKTVAKILTVVLLLMSVLPIAAAAAVATPPYENSSFYMQGDYTIHYRTFSPQGDSKGLLLLVHGFTASTATWLNTAAKLVDAGYTCVLPDLPGHGYSTREGSEIEEIEREELLVGLMQTIAPLSEWTVAGHSMGGGVTLNLALQHPELKSIMLFCPANIAGGAFEAMNKIPAEILGGFCNVLLRLVVSSPTIIRLGVWLASNDWDYAKGYDPALITEPLKIKNSGKSMAYMLRRATAVDTAAIGDIEMPILLVYGDSDKVINSSLEHELADNLPQAQRHTIKGGGHLLIENRADEVSAIILNFLDNK